MTDNSETLEEKLKQKLTNGEITQEEYDELYKKFVSLNLISDEARSKQSFKSLNIDGSRIVDGGNIDGPVTISGKVTIDGYLSCNRLSTSGSTTITDNLEVRGKTSVTGELFVGGETKFGDNVSASGTIKSDGNLYNLGSLTVTGSLICDSTIKANKILKIIGRLEGNKIETTDIIRISGTIKSGSILAKEFDFTSNRNQPQVKSIVNGDIKAEKVSISSNIIPLNINLDNLELNLDNITSFNDMGKAFGEMGKAINNFVKNVTPQILDGITGTIDGIANLVDSLNFDVANSDTTIKSPQFEVMGDIVANQVIISHSYVRGNIIADDIKIGPNVIIDGVAKYRNDISVSDKSKVNSEKIS